MKRDFLKEELEKDYDFELGRVISEIRKLSNFRMLRNDRISDIKKQKAKIVCLQFPDGLKKKATEIAEYIEKNTKSKCVIWMGSCFGACDIPNAKSDLLIQFGHSEL